MQRKQRQFSWLVYRICARSWNCECARNQILSSSQQQHQAGFQGARLKACDFACLHDNLEAAQYLLHEEADPDRSTESMVIPLIGAILCKNLDFVRLLLEHGADPNSRPKSHQIIHDLENRGGGFDPLSTDHASTVISLAHYESLRCADPILEAVETRCTPLVQVLLDFGAVSLRARPKVKDHPTSSWRSTSFKVESVSYTTSFTLRQPKPQNVVSPYSSQALRH